MEVPPGPPVLSTDAVVQTLRLALSGGMPASVHLAGERQPLMIRTVLPRNRRSGMVALSQIPMKTATGHMVPLVELVSIAKVPENQPIHHKNLDRVVYVMSEMAGRAPGEAVLDMMGRLKQDPVPDGIRVEWAGEGEWKITLRVFRDMGIAFAAAMVLIYILLVIQTGSFFMPMLIMMAIPLTLIGAIRMRPILLTAATTALGAWPITLDPVFSGLAWTLIFGLAASTLFTLIIIPVTYFALYRKKYSVN